MGNTTTIPGSIRSEYVTQPEKCVVSFETSETRISFKKHKTVKFSKPLQFSNEGNAVTTLSKSKSDTSLSLKNKLSFRIRHFSKPRLGEVQKDKNENFLLTEINKKYSGNDVLYNFLVSKTMTDDLQVEFDSEVSGFDSRELRSVVSCKNKLIFIFRVNGDIFGFYQDELVQPSKTNSINAESDNFFLFSFKLTDSTPSEFLRKTQNKSSFILYPDSNKMIISVFSAFWMDKKGTISFNPCVRDFYDVQNQTFNPFVDFDTKDRQSLICSRLIVLKA
ncbi:hypothetical protein EIN_511990 [Entamoeba invadens IP1]|uniref:TLDc domain-containing protein n=1 Tax=Entamoeba invadens IP1 TaxID=370355 RepID=A0A0A1UFB5_ENTIV|nr:hypothetical protein EIN_511990 [Entamoeba invadens IP1]ELP91506.1 hypothetical protein EIN_511990 [Entamoeba invadens IP1]|eukprot:XP_004258277.1 hypothetical protein EIN_511990 [Entamoeba invadens IP1]